MSRLISDIIGAPEPTFTHEIQRLERLAGYPKEDLRLISDIHQHAGKISARLGLDATDTTPDELYFALQKWSLEQNEQFAKKLQITPEDSPQNMVDACIKYTQKIIGKRTVWGLKNVTAKNYLKAHPPKKLMKILGLRSVDSALKREAPGMLLFLATITEPSSWVEEYFHAALKTTSNDFDKKKIEITSIDDRRQKLLKKSNHNLRQVIYRHDETATLVVITPQKRFTGDVLFVLDAIIRESNNVRRFSSFAKLLSMRPDFSSWLNALRREGLDTASSYYFNLGWGPVHRLLEKQSDTENEAIFDPHLYHDDVHISHLELDEIVSVNFVFKKDDGSLVSTNISDVIFNVANNNTPASSNTVYGRRALYDELFSRYLAHEPVLDDLIRRQG